MGESILGAEVEQVKAGLLEQSKTNGNGAEVLSKGVQKLVDLSNLKEQFKKSVVCPPHLEWIALIYGWQNEEMEAYAHGKVNWLELRMAYYDLMRQIEKVGKLRTESRKLPEGQAWQLRIAKHKVGGRIDATLSGEPNWLVLRALLEAEHEFLLQHHVRGIGG